MKYPKVDFKDLKLDASILTLQIAKNKLNGYVCFAIADTTAGLKLKERIREALAPKQTLDGWLGMLARQGDSEAKEALAQFEKDNILYRLEWINHMMKELQDEIPESYLPRAKYS